MDRSAGRTVFIYSATGANEQLGGLINTRGITNKNFYEMLEIVLVFASPYTLTLTGEIVPRDGAELQRGDYYVDGKSKTPAHLYTGLLICSREIYCQRRASPLSVRLSFHGIPRPAIHDCSP